MSKMRMTAAFAAIVSLGVSIGLPSPVLAAAKDYRFELTGSPTRSGKATLIRLRLIHLPDGKPVPGAILIRTKLDMGPDGMASMTAPAKPAAPEAEPGIYQISAEPGMAGNWALHLSAKVQGEAETVSGTLTVPIAK